MGLPDMEEMNESLEGSTKETAGWETNAQENGDSQPKEPYEVDVLNKLGPWLDRI